MSDERWRDPCYAMADLLASTMQKLAENEGRKYLFVWERDACLYLIDRLDQGTYEGTLWTSNFLRLNRQAIEASQNPTMNFNLRQARLDGILE
ncbi:MAG: hypothetical protein AAGK02_07155 [Pseudomonadota bacterium]